MTKLTRDEQMVRAAKARAAITSILSEYRGTKTAGEIYEALHALTSSDLTVGEVGNLLGRMAADGLVVKHEVNRPPYKFGYSETGAASAVPEKKPKQGKPAKVVKKEIPIDVQVNEREGSITISYAGLRISFSKKD